MTKTRQATIVRYLVAMERSDLDAVCDCFTANAIIKSPVYGDVPIRPFYQKLFDDTVSAAVNLQQIYCGQDNPDLFSAHFSYKWLRKSGAFLDTDLVDLFEFEENLIAKLQIVFDPSSKH